MTPLDISRSICEAKRVGSKPGIIAFPNMVSSVKAYEEIADAHLNVIVVNDENEVNMAMKQMVDDGVDVVVGGGIIRKFTESYALKTVVFDVDKEVIVSAIEEAKRIISSIAREKESGQRFKTIIESIHNGVISIDQDERIQIFSPSAEFLLSVKKEDVLGKKVDQVLPWLHLTDVLHTQQEELDLIRSHRGRSYIFSKIPVSVSGESRGAVAVIDDMETIRRMEEKNRREYLKKGHFAKHRFHDIITCTKEIKDVIAIAKEYALSESTILIEGETGTGKEIFAQSIHNYSARAKGPFVAVNCAALPESLLESELFGYVSGAFTGADRKGKQGLFEMAHGGTIFLDEISEMNPALQGRLLRVLQEKSIMRIGDDKLLPIDIRVIAASNRDVRQLVKEGKFRKDLFYRLNVLDLHLTSMRNRREDILHLLRYFIDEISGDGEKVLGDLTEGQKRILNEYPWHGNTREIQNFAERWVLLNRRKKNTDSDLQNLLLGTWLADEQAGSMDFTIESKDREHILRVLKEHRGNISKSAKELGSSRTTLWRRIKEYDIHF